MHTPSKIIRRSACVGQTGDLFAPQPVPTPSVVSARSVIRESCWFALSFPALAAVALPIDPAPPTVVVAAMQREASVWAVNVSAARSGISAGMPLSVAELKVDSLQVVMRDERRERQALLQRADWATRWTSWVSVQPPDALLLEVRGSLSLFGGLERLQQQLLADFLVQGDSPQWSVAPTALAALWLARARPSTVVESMEALRSVLAVMPLAAIQWPEAVLSTCHRWGVRTLGELRRLPRDGVQRRLGVTVFHELEAAYGERPSLRRRWVAPARFSARVDLPDPCETTHQLLPSMQTLLRQLEDCLRVRAAAVSVVRFTLIHRGQTSTQLSLGRSLPAWRVEDWVPLLTERLTRLSLPAAVEALMLCSSTRVTQVPDSGTLAGHGVSTVVSVAQASLLLDRLRARLGQHAVHGLCEVAEHRPEHAYRCVDSQTLLSQPAPAMGVRLSPQAVSRPLWLLHTPSRLSQIAGRPCYGGRLVLSDGPERIESGWWDGKAIARDYYRAHNPQGLQLWVFRTRAESQPQWFLHGLFG